MPGSGDARPQQHATLLCLMQMKARCNASALNYQWQGPARQWLRHTMHSLECLSMQLSRGTINAAAGANQAGRPPVEAQSFLVVKLLSQPLLHKVSPVGGGVLTQSQDL